MRSVFLPCDTIKEAEIQMPWAAVIVCVCGGYHGFESLYDYEVWKNQK